MEHEDYLSQYMSIKDKEVAAINDALQRLPNNEWQWKWDAAPRVTASPHKWDGSDQVNVVKVKYPVSSDCGIFIQSDYDFETIEVGSLEVAFGDITAILDNMPDMKEYLFCWQRGRMLTNPHTQTFFFEDDDMATKGWREFMNAHKLGMLKIYRIENGKKIMVNNYSW